jgi:hypothetical protein
MKKGYRYNAEYYAKFDLSKDDLFLKQITDICTKITGFYQLDEHERISISHDIFLKLRDKEAQGILDLTDYNQFKGYLFMTARNAVMKILVQEANYKTTKNQIYEHKFSEADKKTYDSMVIESDYSNCVLDSIEEILPSFNPRHQNIIREFLKGKRLFEFPKKADGKSDKAIIAVISRFRDKLQTLLEKRYDITIYRKTAGVGNSDVKRSKATENQKASQKLWRSKNREKCVLYNKNWRLAHPDYRKNKKLNE